MNAAEIALLIILCLILMVVSWIALQIYRYIKAVQSMQEPKTHKRSKP